MRITIDVIDHKDQKYETTGDWGFDTDADGEERLWIKVSRMGSWRAESCVGIHEAVEALICKHLQSEYNRALDDAVVIVNPPEPPKPVLCEGCGHTEAAHVSVMLNGERVSLCSDAKFAPAEESTR